MTRVVFLFVFIGFIHIQGTAAQVILPEYGVYVTAILSDSAGTEGALELEIISQFRSALKTRGVPESGRAQTRVLLDAREVKVGEEMMIVLSISRMDRIPDEVIELGVENEAFYLRTPSEDLPSEGKTVRQRFTRDWMEQFFNIHHQSLYVVKRDDVIFRIAEYVDELVAG